MLQVSECSKKRFSNIWENFILKLKPLQKEKIFYINSVLHNHQLGNVFQFQRFSLTFKFHFLSCSIVKFTQIIYYPFLLRFERNCIVKVISHRFFCQQIDRTYFVCWNLMSLQSLLWSKRFVLKSNILNKEIGYWWQQYCIMCIFSYFRGKVIMFEKKKHVWC